MLSQAQDFDPRLKAQMGDDLTEYEVTLHTADVQDAATDADVFLVLYSATGKRLTVTALTLLVLEDAEHCSKPLGTPSVSQQQCLHRLV